MFLIRKPLFSLLLPLVLAGCASGPDLAARITGRSESAYKETFLSARMAEQKGELLKATQNYETLLKKHPQKAELHHRLGILSQKSGRPEQAVNYLSQAHQLAPMDVEILCDLGYSHYLQGNSDEAVKIFQQAQQINPGHARTQSNLAIALIELNQVPAAMSLLRQGMGEAAAATTVGFALAQKGDLNEAQRYFSQALDSDADNQQAAEALVQIEALLDSQNSTDAAKAVASSDATASEVTEDAAQTTVDTSAAQAMQVITESESIDTIGLTELTADPQPATVAKQIPVSTSERVLSADVINASDLRLTGVARRPNATVASDEGITKVQAAEDSSHNTAVSPIVSVSDSHVVSQGSLREISGSFLQNPESSQAASEARGVWRSARNRSGSAVQTESYTKAESSTAKSDPQLSEFSHGSPIESIHDAGRSNRKAAVIEPWRMAHRESSVDGELPEHEFDHPDFARGPRIVEPSRSWQAVDGWTQRSREQKNSADSTATTPPMIVVSGQVFDYQRLAQLAAAGQLQLTGAAGNQSLPLQAPAVAQVAYTATPGTPQGTPAGYVIPGTPQAALMPVPQAVPAVSQYVPGSATGYGVPVVQQMAAPATPGQLHSGGMVAQYAAPQPEAAPSPIPVTTSPVMAQTAPPAAPVAAALPMVYAQGQPLPAQSMASPLTMPVPAVVAPQPVLSQPTPTSAPAQTQSAAATGTVGGLPLAFLRSFYSQMPQTQQATFWRDLRRLPGAVSPAELAAYRELALSATDIARVEAAITMLAVYKQRELAEELLKGMNNHADPVVQQSAQTALSMLQIQ